MAVYLLPAWCVSQSRGAADTQEILRMLTPAAAKVHTVLTCWPTAAGPVKAAVGSCLLGGQAGLQVLCP